MKVIRKSSGKAVANQFIIVDYTEKKGILITTKIFQSYDSVIVKRTVTTGVKQPDRDYPIERHTYLDRDKWNYSVTTGKYRNQFLGEGIAETRKKIKSGEYELADLNK